MLLLGLLLLLQIDSARDEVLLIADVELALREDTVGSVRHDGVCSGGRLRRRVFLGRFVR